MKKLPEELRELAISLRQEGKTYKQIAGSLGISIGTCSLWLHDVPAPPREPYSQERIAKMWHTRWQPIHKAREEARLRTKLAAGEELGELSDRDVLIAGAMAYWCEGGKSKVYRRDEKVDFINSDPAVIALFLRFLRVAGTDSERLRFRVHIHETADVAAAERYWADLAGIGVSDFQKPLIKRHNPKTVRKNLVEDYHGCLQIRVLKCAELYQRIEGWAYQVMLGRDQAEAHFRERSDRQLDWLAKSREGVAAAK